MTNWQEIYKELKEQRTFYGIADETQQNAENYFNWLEINDAVDFLNKVEANWKRTPKLAEKNNPFYLAILDQQADYRTKITTLQSSDWAKTATTTTRMLSSSSSSYSYQEITEDYQEVYRAYTEQKNK